MVIGGLVIVQFQGVLALSERTGHGPEYCSLEGNSDSSNCRNLKRLAALCSCFTASVGVLSAMIAAVLDE